MIRGKRGRKSRQSRKACDGYGTRRLQVIAKDEINQEGKESSGHSGRRVRMSDSLSTHLDPKSVVARFEKSADVEGRMEFYMQAKWGGNIALADR